MKSRQSVSPHKKGPLLSEDGIFYGTIIKHTKLICKESGIVLSIRYPTASLKPHREESLLGGHLWIFSGALQQPPHWIEAGGLVDVKSAKGQFVARGYYNPNTDIAIRILTYNHEEAIDATFLQQRIRSALELRQVFDPALTNTYRLIHS